MASFAMEEFVGNGVLREIIHIFVAAGWNDVPTLKKINLDDMEFLKLTQQQKDALELRIYLHNRSLMQYADRIEALNTMLPKLMSMNTFTLSSQFGMKRSHVACFLNREISHKILVSPTLFILPTSKNNTTYRTSNGSTHDSNKERKLHKIESHQKLHPNYDASTTNVVLDLKLNDSHLFKGIVASKPVKPRLLSCIRQPRVVNDVAQLSSIANVLVQKITPEYKVGVPHVIENKAPRMKACELWSDKATILLCILRPGCLMCRAEAHQLYSRKPIFDALGFQLIVVLHEQIESEVTDFWPRYWGGIIIVDPTMGFFKALGGGKLLKDNFLTGFILNSHTRANFKAAKATKFDYNFKGDGGIKGGMFIIRSGKGGIAYQFIERNFGDWVPISEVLEICNRIKNES